MKLFNKHKHKWSKWEIIENGDMFKNGWGKRFKFGTYFIQERKCTECGFVERQKDEKII